MLCFPDGGEIRLPDEGDARIRGPTQELFPDNGP